MFWHSKWEHLIWIKGQNTIRANLARITMLYILLQQTRWNECSFQISSRATKLNEGGKIITAGIQNKKWQRYFPRQIDNIHCKRWRQKPDTDIQIPLRAQHKHLVVISGSAPWDNFALWPNYHLMCSSDIPSGLTSTLSNNSSFTLMFTFYTTTYITIYYYNRLPSCPLCS